MIFKVRYALKALEGLTTCNLGLWHNPVSSRFSLAPAGVKTTDVTGRAVGGTITGRLLSYCRLSPTGVP